MRAINYVRSNFPFFNKTLEKRRPSHILPPHTDDGVLADCECTHAVPHLISPRPFSASALSSSCSS